MSQYSAMLAGTQHYRDSARIQTDLTIIRVELLNTLGIASCSCCAI